MSEEISQNQTESRIISDNGGGGGDATWRQHRHQQFGDTTETKVFVGGLPWGSKKESVENYFKQFGEILEAVVITDKNTGRSKGYGFVTFKEPESAIKACEDSAPIIDGRRANCNIAANGAHQRSTTAFASRQGMKGPRRKLVGSSSMTQDYDASSSPAHQHLKNQQFFPYAPSPYFYYGYNGYSHDIYNNFYNAYYSSMGLSSHAAATAYYSNYYHQLQNQPKHGHYAPGSTSQSRQPPQLLMQQEEQQNQNLPPRLGYSNQQPYSNPDSNSSPVVSSNGMATEETEEMEARGVNKREEANGETGSISRS